MKISIKTNYVLKIQHLIYQWGRISRANSQHRSLLIVGNPRGFTSQTYMIARSVTGLKEVFWSAGEVLNADRLRNSSAFWFWHLKAPAAMLSFKRHRPRSVCDQAYAAVEASLDQIPEKGYVIKDVCYPQLVHRYITQHPNRFNVIFVHRDPRKVSISIKLKGWNHSTEAQELVRNMYDDFPFIDADEAIVNYRHIPEKLHSTFGYKVRYINYLYGDFLKKRDRIERKYDEHC